MKLPADPTVLADRAWVMIAEAFETGMMTLEDGTKVNIDSRELTQLTRWVANLKQRKPKLLTVDDDFKVAKTNGG